MILKNICLLNVPVDAVFISFTLGQAPADLVLRNGKIVTVDEKIGEVRALAARDGRIVAVGSEAEIQR